MHRYERDVVARLAGADLLAHQVVAERVGIGRTGEDILRQPRQRHVDGLRASGRATRTPVGLIAAERLPELLAVHPGIALDPPVTPPASRSRAWTKDAAIVELLRGRLTIVGPTTAEALAESLQIEVNEADAALLALETEGVILRGHFERAERSEPTPFDDAQGVVSRVEPTERRASAASLSEGPEGTAAERRPRAPKKMTRVGIEPTTL